jgi:hypothetical protein
MAEQGDPDRKGHQTAKRNGGRLYTKHKADKLYGGKYVKGVRKPAGGDEVGEWGDYSVQDRRQGVFGNVRLYG